VTRRGNGESAALDRLEADDAALEKVLDEARGAAARTVEAARSRAARASAEARAALDAEVASLLDEGARDAAAIDAGAEGRARATAEAVRDQAAARLEGAVAAALHAVCGEAP
jgi:vacuolar-type H+-ATPase subunit H